jgi:hypothetical protein
MTSIPNLIAVSSSQLSFNTNHAPVQAYIYNAYANSNYIVRHQQSLGSGDEEMFTPVGCDKYLVWVQIRAYLHPLVVLRIHASKALRFAECGRHVLAKQVYGGPFLSK